MLDKLVDVLQGMVLLMMCIQDMRKSSQISRLQNDVLSLFHKVDYMDNVEQRCGTCTERFQCPAWPGVCYPCPHYIDQDGIMEERQRKYEQEEADFWAIQERLREEFMNDGKEE